VLSELRFRRNHHVVSLIATLPHAEMASLVTPAERVTKALPIPMVAHRQGATIIFPPDPGTAALFGRLGTVIEVDDPAEFAALSVATATFAAYFKYLDTIHGWLEGHGVAGERARDYLVALFKGLAGASDASPSTDFMGLAEEYATRGGINEQVLRELTSRNVFDVLSESLDAVHRRVSGGAG
jgi:pyrroline-5-carboxylate reductase